VDGFIKENGIRTACHKKRAEEYSKLQIVPLPDLTLRLRKEHIERKGLKDGGFCFADKKNPSQPITEYYVRYHMARIIEKAGIQAQGRKLTARSFRFTYVMFMRRELPAMTVMKLVGHTAIRMMEYHNRRGIDESLAGLRGGPDGGKTLCLTGILDKQSLSGRTGLGLGGSNTENIYEGEILIPVYSFH
jgi:integrase